MGNGQHRTGDRNRIFEQGNDDSARWHDEDNEPQCYAVGRPSLNAEGVQDEATADFDDEEVA